MRRMDEWLAASNAEILVVATDSMATMPSWRSRVILLDRGRIVRGQLAAVA